jgi:hypothetical protein
VLISQENLFFSEIVSGYNYFSESRDPAESSLLLRTDLFFDRPNLTIILSNQLDQFTGNYSISNLSAAISLEKRFSAFSNNTLFQFKELTIEEYQFIDLSNTFLWNIESASNVTEAGFNFTWEKCLEHPDYQELSGTLYYLKKNYLNNFSLHQKIDFSLWQLISEEEVSNLLPNLSYEIILTAPVKKDLGLAVNLNLNQNLKTEDSVFAPNEDFYSAVSYNSQTIGAGFTFIKNNYLLKPRVSVSSRQYLSVAVEEEFQETEFDCGLYGDLILPGNLLLYADLGYSRINDDSGWNEIYIVSSGLKYQFDLYVR